jgi:hypothetical protein
MNDLEFMLNRYLKLREAIANWLKKNFDEDAWYFQPAPAANSAAWIVPHLIVFEQIKVYDQIPGYAFHRVATEEQVARYKPGAAGYAMGRGELMPMHDVLVGLAATRKITETFFHALLTDSPLVAEVDRRVAFDRYFLNFTHDTEHYGQIKYLTGLWQRRK